MPRQVSSARHERRLERQLPALLAGPRAARAAALVDAGLNRRAARRACTASGTRAACGAPTPRPSRRWGYSAAGGKTHARHGTDVALPPGVRLATPARRAARRREDGGGGGCVIGGPPHASRGGGAGPLPLRRRGATNTVGVLRRLEVHVDDHAGSTQVPASGRRAARRSPWTPGGLAPRRRHRRRRLVRRRRGRRGGRAALARVVRRLRRSALLPSPSSAARRRPAASPWPGAAAAARVRDGGGRAENDDNPPKHLFERLEREAHGAVQHPAQELLLFQQHQALAGCGRRGGFGRAAAHDGRHAR